MNGNHKQFSVLVYRFNMFKLMEISPIENPDKHDWFVRLKNFFLLFTNKSFYPLSFKQLIYKSKKFMLFQLLFILVKIIKKIELAL